MMRYRASFITGLAAGYVLGAKAGRERYEKIKRAAQSTWSNPKVQQAADTVQARTGNVVGTAAHAAAEKGKVISQRVGDKLPNRLTDKLPAGMRGRQEDEEAWRDYATSAATSGAASSAAGTASSQPSHPHNGHTTPATGTTGTTGPAVPPDPTASPPAP